MDNEKTKVDLQKNLLQFGRTSIIEAYKDLKINLGDEKISDEILAQQLIKNIELDKTKIEEFKLYLGYLHLYPKIKSLLNEDLLELIPIDRRGRIKKREERISHIKYLLLNKEIDIEQLKKKIDVKLILLKIRKIKSLDNLVSFARKIREPVADIPNRENLIKKIALGLETGKYLPEDLEKYLGETKIEVKKSKPTESINKLLKEIESLKEHIVSMERELGTQKNTLINLNSNFEKTKESIRLNYDLIKSYFDKIEGSFNIGRTEKLIAALRREDLNVTEINSQLFDSLRNSLKKDNLSDIDILRDGLAVMIMNYLMKLTKEMEWEVNLDLFYRILSEEIIKLGGTANFSAKIPMVRDLVCKRMNIEPQKFDSLLLDCREKGWVLLEVGTPIGETEAGWLDTGKNRFYYVKLQRK